MDERLVVHGLALTKAIEDGDRRRLQAVVAGLEETIRLARGVRT